MHARQKCKISCFNERIEEQFCFYWQYCYVNQHYMVVLCMYMLL